MSCVVGLIQNNKLFIGSDSRATTDDGEVRYIKSRKIFRYDDPKMLIGFAGSVRSGQVLHPYYFSPPAEIMDLPDVMRAHFEKAGCLSADPESGMEATRSNFLIGYNGKLYEILVDFQLNEIDENYTAIGYGQSFAVASFYTSEMYNEDDPEKRIKIALNSACKYTGFCHPPLIIESLDY